MTFPHRSRRFTVEGVLSVAAPRNGRERLISYMAELRRHLLKCYTCKGALKSGTPLCDVGARLTVSAASEFNSVIELRRKAMARGDGTMVACPDLSRHGESYALTAPLFYVTAVKEELF